MFKKTTVYIVSLFFILLLATPVLAADELLVKTDQSKYQLNEQVYISGETTSDKIALEIKDAGGNIVFVEEIKVQNNKFSTTYKLTKTITGTYLITVYGQGKYATGNFVVEKPPPDNSSSGGSGGGGGVKNKSDNYVSKTVAINERGEVVETVTINADSLKQLTNSNEKKNIIEIDVGEKSKTLPDVVSVNIPHAVFDIFKDRGIKIITNQVSLELPKELVETISTDTAGLSIEIKHEEVGAVKEALTEIPEISNALIIGKPTSIKTKLVGNTIVSIPLTDIDIPQDLKERNSFLNSLKILAIHSDGEKRIIKPNILYTDSGKPAALEFEVSKFSTFAIIKLPPTEISLYLNKREALVDGKRYLLDAEPYLNSKSNRVLVPVRFVSEALGAEVKYIKDSKSVIITQGTNELRFGIGLNKALVNQKEVYLDCPAAVMYDRTFLPVRFISESLGAKVTYNGESQQIVICK